jgi:Fic family protein
MSFTDKLVQIELLRQQIEEHGKLPEEVLKKVNYKFRLEWNYNSNSMEGNSLTRLETRSVMVGNITVDGKPIKDVLEMKNHDDVIANIIKVGKGELNVSEKRIKEIHKGIMHEEDPEKAKLIGQWKTAPNYLSNYKNERFDFVAPADVPERMHQLINWLNTQKEKIQKGDKDALHPVMVAFRFHLDYTTIHPFYDGNGRTARILTNLILISYGYPPVYIKQDEKDRYYQYLADIQGYGGEPDLIYDFMAGLLMRSQQLVIDAMEGKDIAEPDDIDKEIELFKRSLDRTGERKKIRTWENITTVIEQSAIPLFLQLQQKLSRFEELFHKNENRIIFSTADSDTYDIKNRIGGFVISAELISESLINNLSNYREESPTGELESVGMDYFLKGYKRSYPFDMGIVIAFLFDEYTYSLISDGTFFSSVGYYEKNYEDQLTNEEMLYAINDLAKRVLEYLKSRE